MAFGATRNPLSWSFRAPTITLIIYLLILVGHTATVSAASSAFIGFPTACNRDSPAVISLSASQTPSTTRNTMTNQAQTKPTPENPWYSDASIGRDRNQVLKYREADWEAVGSEKARFVLQTSNGMHYQKDSKVDNVPKPLWLTFSQLEAIFGTEKIQQATTSDDKGNILAWAGRHEEHDYWAYYRKNLSEWEEANLQKYCSDAQVAGLREFGDSLLSITDAAILATCNGLIEFHKTHLFCSRCGSKTRITKAGGARKCTNDDSCGASTYPRIDVASIMLITSQCGEFALLGRKHFWPKGRYSTLAGFAEIGETMEQCCIRETFEESGVRVEPSSLRFVCSQPWPFPRSLMVGFRAKAAEPGLPEINIEEDEMESVKWFKRDYVKERLDGGSTALTFEPSEREQEFHIPGPASLARLLITEWANESESD